MKNFLYERFLEDKRVYLAARAFWFKQARQIIPNRELLPSYVSERFHNGEFFFDGNPIFNIINRNTNKAARIIQESPSKLDNFYSSWDQETQLPPTSNSSSIVVREKVIVLTLTSKNLERAKNELRIWFQN